MGDTIYVLYEKNSTTEKLRTSSKKELIATIFTEAINFWENETIGIPELRIRKSTTKCDDGNTLEVYNVIYDASPENYFDVAYNVKVIKGGK